ncbi:MAG TPA: prepilin-type N-terminal cleavage/methylation domain-containing protein [Phycisphaerae bacterium]|nr:prepilin-type N-terminal cleavage/methylation domain-containing protein [Phycisphaerae bacterium]
MRKTAGFTLIEVLVVILIIVILVGIGLAIGAQVQANAQTSVLKEELLDLQSALTWYQQQSGGQTPSGDYGTYPAMLVFLENYQRMNSLKASNGTWHIKANIFSQLPANLIVSGQFPAPDGTAMTGVIEILDPWNNPIQYMPTSGYVTFFPVSASTSVITSANFAISQPSTFPSYINYLSGTNSPPAPPVSGTTSPSSMPCNLNSVPPAIIPPHAPYFYSFSSKGPQATGITYGNYVYSYGP